MRRLFALMGLGLAGVIALAVLLAAANQVAEAVWKTTTYWPGDP